jgi:hypothetical protein
MPNILTLLALKLLSLLGATLNTLGFLTFFFFDGLQPWRWPLIGGGVLLIALGEGLAYLLGRRIARQQVGADEAP